MDNYFEKKHDQGKLLWHLLPTESLQEVIKILMFGMQKGYAEESWKTVPNGKIRYMDALKRHLAEIDLEREAGSKEYLSAKDKESGLFTLAHAACNAVFLLWLAVQEEKANTKTEPPIYFLD